MRSDSGIFIMKALDLYDGERLIFFNDVVSEYGGERALYMLLYPMEAIQLLPRVSTSLWVLIFFSCSKPPKLYPRVWFGTGNVLRFCYREALLPIISTEYVLCLVGAVASWFSNQLGWKRF